MNKTTTTISYITVIAIASKLFGFVREMVIAAYYGASWQTDAFNMANSIIGLSTAIISMGIATVVVPMYNHRLVQEGKDEADAFASNILSITSLIYGVLAALSIIFAPFLAKLFAPDFDSEVVALLVRLLRILYIFTIATNAVNFLSAVSRANKKFLVPSLVGFPLSIMLVLSITLFSNHFGIYAMVAGTISAILIQVLLLIISLRKSFRFKPMLNFTNGDAKAIVLLSVPIFISVGVDQLSGLIDRMLASGLTEGSISAMNYAYKLRELPNGIIATSVVTVIFPLFAQYAAQNDFDRVKSLVNKSMSMLFASMAPITLVCIYYSKEIVRIVYERGAFTHEQTELTAHILIFASIALFFMGGTSTLNNAFYGMQDTKTPRLGAVIAVISDIILNLILVRYMQAAGLVLASSIAFILNYLILLIFFRKKFGSFGGVSFAWNGIKCAVAAVGMIPVFLICEFFRAVLPTIIFFGVCVILGFILYAVLLYVMKAEIFMLGLNKVKDIIKKK